MTSGRRELCLALLNSFDHIVHEIRSFSNEHSIWMQQSLGQLDLER